MYEQEAWVVIDFFLQECRCVALWEKLVLTIGTKSLAVLGMNFGANPSACRVLEMAPTVSLSGYT